MGKTAGGGWNHLSEYRFISYWIANTYCYTLLQHFTLFPPNITIISILHCINYCIIHIPAVHPRMTALPPSLHPPLPGWDARLVWSAPPLSYVSPMVVSIGRRSNDSACLPVCTFPYSRDAARLMKKAFSTPCVPVWSGSSPHIPLKVSSGVQRLCCYFRNDSAGSYFWYSRISRFLIKV